MFYKQECFNACTVSSSGGQALLHSTKLSLRDKLWVELIFEEHIAYTSLEQIRCKSPTIFPHEYIVFRSTRYMPSTISNSCQKIA